MQHEVDGSLIFDLFFVVRSEGVTGSDPFTSTYPLLQGEEPAPCQRASITPVAMLQVTHFCYVFLCCTWSCVLSANSETA